MGILEFLGWSAAIFLVVIIFGATFIVFKREYHKGEDENE